MDLKAASSSNTSDLRRHSRITSSIGSGAAQGRRCRPNAAPANGMTVFQKRAFDRAILGLTPTYIRVQLVNREGLPGDYLAHEIAHGDNALELAIL
jgi:hypothetical protein